MYEIISDENQSVEMIQKEEFSSKTNKNQNFDELSEDEQIMVTFAIKDVQNLLRKQNKNIEMK